MKNITLFLIFFTSTCFAQKVYQNNEVEKVAEPSGGKDILDYYFSSNLRIPIKSAAKGLDKNVMIKAVIETDGSASQVQIVSGIDSLCDVEAKRVVSLFRAWKPAEIKNEKVRQAVEIAVKFKSEPLLNYDEEKKCLNVYYDRRGKQLSGNKTSKYRMNIPVDDFGFVNGNILSQEKTSDGWNIKHSIILKEEKYWRKNEITDSVQAVRTFSSEGWYDVPVFQVVDRKLNGEILYINQFSYGGKPDIQKEYYLDGMVKSMKITANSVWQETKWYENGQLTSITENPKLSKGSSAVPLLKDFRDVSGNQLVKDGNGQGEFATETYHEQTIYDRGTVKAGLKEGIWIGQLKDGTKLFEELYTGGKLVKGTSYMDGETIEYTELGIQPQYQGGFSEMYKFLGKNIKYPKDAARAGISGRVFTSFVVCEDGTLCDYQVIKGVHKSMDEEALRVVSEMSGKWEPGWMRGKKVRVKFNLPINFSF
ncbi:energy transducer TonB [Dyadobacter diqingensis]|uniref:energy transducer TonB n=1 Tax=Dyadobacter diqingensis TaxID=2938121 RepID=UPI0020C399FB|nr:energy transducer TonB [Dyadobacter diqingensis]